MANKYIFVRIKDEDYKKISQKKDCLKFDIEKILGKKIKFSNPDFFRTIANGYLDINPDKAANIFKLKNLNGGKR